MILSKTRHGFTLIELSIVLVIIGLIVGGVLVGRDLIKAAEIRAQIKLVEEFKTAANAFKLKYGYLPADIPPAQAAQLGFFTFTGTYAGKSRLAPFGPPYGYLVYGYGNNNGRIDQGELYLFWQHLSEAKLIAGTYGGSTGGVNYLNPDTDGSNPGLPVNPTPNVSDYFIFAPQGKLAASNNLISAKSNYTYSTLPYYYNATDNFFQFSATPNQQYAIDSKIDDGFPDKGKVRNMGTYTPGHGGMAETGFSPCVISLPSKAYDLTPTTADKTDSCYLAILW